MLGPDAITHPTGIGQQRVCFGATGRHQCTPHANRKWQVCLAVTVKMSDFALVDAKFHTTEAMGRDFDTVPLADDVDDVATDFVERHDRHVRIDRSMFAGGGVGCEARATDFEALAARFV